MTLPEHLKDWLFFPLPYNLWHLGIYDSHSKNFQQKFSATSALGGTLGHGLPQVGCQSTSGCLSDTLSSAQLSLKSAVGVKWGEALRGAACH